MSDGALPPAAWETWLTVASHETGPHGLAAPAAVLRWLQEAAGEHAERLGWGQDALRAEGGAWVLVRQRLHIQTPLHGGQRLRIATWPCGLEGLLYRRDFALWNARGERVAAAASGWVVLDLATRRPRKGHATAALPMLPPLFAEPFSRLTSLRGSASRRRFEAGFMDLDRNRHATHGRLVEWLLESLPGTYLEGHRLVDLEVHYLHEVRYGEVVEAGGVEEAANAFRHNLLRRVDGTEVCRARSRWSRTDQI
jgi:acyl-CoA thioesterase FadM